MRGFDSQDPNEIHNPTTMQDILLHHEAAHIVLAYFYGLRIGKFRRVVVNGIFSASALSDTNDAYLDRNGPVAADLLSRKLLAGEIAGRKRAGVATDRFTLPLLSPAVDSVTANTSFLDLKYDTRTPQHDSLKVLDRYGWAFARHQMDAINKLKRLFNPQIQDNWWTWFWHNHEIASTDVTRLWEPLHNLTERLQQRNPNNDVTGGELVQWCTDLTVPLYKAEWKPIDLI